MIKSSQPRKQRKFRYQAPHHQRHKFLGAMLSPELREKHGVKSVPVRLGDTVRVMRGDNRDTEGKVAAVDYKNTAIAVDGVAVTKADGTEVPRPIHPSNAMITKLNTEDERRLGD